MTDYRLLPVEATPEMEQAAEKYWYDRKFKALSYDPRTWKGLYAAMRAAAPAVQGEPLGYVVPRMAARLGKGELCGISVLDQPEDGHTLPVYLGPQPAEQQPDVAQLVGADDYKTWYEEAIVRSNEAGFAGVSATQVIDYQDGEITQLRTGNARLVEALETIVDLPIDPCSTENDYRLAAAKSIASAALAANRRVTQP